MSGGVNCITEAAPTNFHNFFKQKILTANETISDYKEVTPAERTAIEAADAMWTRPPQSFIDEWNGLCTVNHPLSPWGINETIGKVGGYNESTGYFELNGFTDIDYEEAMRIRSYYCGRRQPLSLHLFQQVAERTFLPLILGINGSGPAEYLFAECINIEVITVISSALTNIWNFFNCCHKLRKVNGVFYPTSSANIAGAFNKCYALEEIRFFNLCKSISFADSPNLSLESISYMIARSFYGKNPTPITITLHADAYARVTEDIFAAATAKQITIASA